MNYINHNTDGGTGERASPNFGFAKNDSARRAMTIVGTRPELTEACCVPFDIGTIKEESSLLNSSAITLHKACERPEGMDVDTSILSGLKKDRVIEVVERITSQRSNAIAPVLPIPHYENPLVSKQIVRVVTSYIDYINRVTWFKAN